MNYLKLTKFDTANGPGIRDVLWVSGCEHHCKECHNQSTWDKTVGEAITASLVDEIIDDLNHPHIQGITFSGGDPLAVYNREEITEIAKTLKKVLPKKTIWCYTGYSWEDIKDLEIMKYVDVVVDGKFLIEQRDISLPYCGSKNQRVIDVQKSLNKGYPVIWGN